MFDNDFLFTLLGYGDWLSYFLVSPYVVSIVLLSFTPLARVGQGEIQEYRQPDIRALYK